MDPSAAPVRVVCQLRATLDPQPLAINIELRRQRALYDDERAAAYARECRFRLLMAL
jgi:hypothetical protein